MDLKSSLVQLLLGQCPVESPGMEIAEPPWAACPTAGLSSWWKHCFPYAAWASRASVYALCPSSSLQEQLQRAWLHFLDNCPPSPGGMQLDAPKVIPCCGMEQLLPSTSLPHRASGPALGVLGTLCWAHFVISISLDSQNWAEHYRYDLMNAEVKK